METVYKDYSAKGVRFYYIYKSLAHPEYGGYVTPYTLKERFMHVREAKRTIGSEIPWLVDGLDNAVKNALGRKSNPEFIVDPQGIVVRKRAWSDPDQLRADLVELLGPVENPTRVEDLTVTKSEPAKAAPAGIVPRLELPRRMRPLLVEPVSSAHDEPFYAKLRVEAERGLLDSGAGKLYLRFQMDPLYKVHWNNLVPPLHVELTPPPGLTLSETSLNGPKVEAEADIDPREFLIDVKKAQEEVGPIELTAHYFACSDEPAWCKPMTQTYRVVLERDRGGGSVFRGRMRDMVKKETKDDKK